LLQRNSVSSPAVMLEGNVVNFAVADNGELYEMENSGALWQHTVDGWLHLDSMAQQILLPRGGELIDLEKGGALFEHNWTGWTQIDLGVQTNPPISLAADGFTVQFTDGGGAEMLPAVAEAQTSSTAVVDMLLSDGSLWQHTPSGALAANPQTLITARLPLLVVPHLDVDLSGYGPQYALGGWQRLDSIAAMVAVAGDGTIYDVENNQQLFQYKNGVFSSLDRNVQQIGVTANNTLIDLETNGNIYSYIGGVFTQQLRGVTVTSFTINGNTVTAATSQGPKQFSV
jgi:hypothetical protein